MKRLFSYQPIVPLILIFFSVIPAPVLAQQGSSGGITVLRGATVIDGRGGAPVPDAVVVIEGDQIRSVGGQATSVPAGAAVVELSGKFIIPGLLESHSHYEAWMGELLLNHGVTAALAVGGRLGKAKEATQQSGARVPRLYDTAGDPRLSASMTQQQVQASVREWLKSKPDFARLRDYKVQLFDPVYRWAAEEIHKAGLMIFGHTMDAPASIRSGQDVVEHIWGFVMPLLSPQEMKDFQEGRSLHWSLFFADWSRLDPMIREAVGQGAYVNPTFVYELGSLSKHAAKHEMETYRLMQDASLMAYYPQNIAGSLLQKQRQIRNFSAKYENLVRLSRLTPQERQEFERGYRLAGQFLKRWVDAGGKIQAGTDTVSGGTPGLSLHHEMELLVEAGLTSMQALQSSTLWSAEMLAGKGGALGSPKVGVIEQGAFADLVVLSADPLADISNTRKIERVMKGGQFVELGYDPAYYSFTRPPRSIAMATPVPEISAITPHTVIEGGGEFEMTVEGVGFVGNSVVRVEGVSLATTFLDPRRLRVRIPADLVKNAARSPFDAPGPAQAVGVFGDRTLAITVFNPPPEGGLSNSVSLRIQGKWRAQ